MVVQAVLRQCCTCIAQADHVSQLSYELRHEKTYLPGFLTRYCSAKDIS